MSGVKLTILTVVVAGLATISGQTVLYHLTDVLVATLVVCLIWSWFSVRGLQLERHLRQDRAQAGGALEQRLELKSRFPLPRIWLELNDGGTIPDYRGGRVLDLGFGGRRIWTQDVPCRRRGLYELGPARVSGTDPFGLFRMSRRLGPVRSVLVYPATVELQGLALAAGQHQGGDRRRSGWHQTTPFIAGIREYQPGDPVRHVHWRSTAHAGRLMVKEFDAEPVADVWVLLDLDASQQRGEGDESTEEYGVTIAASVSKHFLGQGRAVGLVAVAAEHRVVQADRGQRQLTKLLEELALIHADGSEPIAGVLATETDRCRRSAAVLLVTASTDDHWPHVLRQLRDRGIQAGVVLLEASTFGEADSSLLTVGALAANGVPSLLVKRGDNLSQVLTAGGGARSSTSASWVSRG
jgi:uncharacterized protein (DUF58 family)